MTYVLWWLAFGAGGGYLHDRQEMKKPIPYGDFPARPLQEIRVSTYIGFGIFGLIGFIGVVGLLIATKLGVKTTE